MCFHPVKRNWFDENHENNFLMTSPYLSPLSGSSVTIIPFSMAEATRMAPTRLAAEEGLSIRPFSCFTRCSLSFCSSFFCLLFFIEFYIFFCFHICYRLSLSFF